MHGSRWKTRKGYMGRVPTPNFVWTIYYFINKKKERKKKRKEKVILHKFLFFRLEYKA